MTNPTPEQRRAFTPEQRAAQDRADLDATLELVRTLMPTAVAVNIETSDQDTYGFVLASVEDGDGTVIPRVRGTGSTTHGLPSLDGEEWDAVDDLLMDLNWNGVVGEDKHGNARLPLIIDNDTVRELFITPLAVLDADDDATGATNGILVRNIVADLANERTRLRAVLNDDTITDCPVTDDGPHWVLTVNRQAGTVVTDMAMTLAEVESKVAGYDLADHHEIVVVPVAPIPHGQGG